MRNYLKSCLVLIGALLALSAALSFADAHAADKATSNIHVKEMAAPPTYLVDGKEVNAAEATVAVLRGAKALKCTEMEVEASRSGLSLKAKKNK